MFGTIVTEERNSMYLFIFVKGWIVAIAGAFKDIKHVQRNNNLVHVPIAV